MVTRFNHTSSCTDSNFSFSHTTRLAYCPEAWWTLDALAIQMFIDLCKVKDLDEFRQDDWYILQLSINSFPQSNIEESAQDVLIVMNNIEAAWHHNRVVSMLAYDKTGFFNSSPTPFWSQQCVHYISPSQLLNGRYLFLQNRKATRPGECQLQSQFRNLTATTPQLCSAMLIELCNCLKWSVKDLDKFRQDNWYILQLSINSSPQSNIEGSTQDVLMVMNDVESSLAPQ